ncbi:MAG: hypothetical protein LBP54_05730 [Campylobacteraceae bacterium]|jgi:hypothetical protein|nr:hypothetical protein [Campylobacteraceae bacterium]
MSKQLTNRFFVLLVNTFAFKASASYRAVHSVHADTVLNTLETLNMLGAAK